jgi:hypothetical protein
LLLVSLYLGAHLGDDLRHVRIDYGVTQPGPSQDCTHNARICIAVDGNALNAGFFIEDRPHRVLERKVVNGIAAVEQSAVNVEQKDVSGVPAEPGSHEYVPAGGSWDHS